MKHNRIVAIISIVGLAALFIMLNFTSPTEIGPFGVLLFFTTLYATLFGVISLSMQIFCRLAYKRPSLKNKEYLYAAVMAFGPIMLMMARSFGAINLWTVSLIVIFIILGEFLVAKRL